MNNKNYPSNPSNRIDQDPSSNYGSSVNFENDADMDFESALQALAQYINQENPDDPDTVDPNNIEMAQMGDVTAIQTLIDFAASKRVMGESEEDFESIQKMDMVVIALEARQRTLLAAAEESAFNQSSEQEHQVDSLVAARYELNEVLGLPSQSELGIKTESEINAEMNPPSDATDTMESETEGEEHKDSLREDQYTDALFEAGLMFGLADPTSLVGGVDFDDMPTTQRFAVYKILAKAIDSNQKDAGYSEARFRETRRLIDEVMRDPDQ